MTADPLSHEASRGLRRSAADGPPPAPPHELEPDTGFCRGFEVDGAAWIARAAGRAAGGTGGYGLAMMEAVHFARAEDPLTPLFEALIAAGRLATLYEDELCSLLRSACRIVVLEEVRAVPEPRGGHTLDEEPLTPP